MDRGESSTKSKYYYLDKDFDTQPWCIMVNYGYLEADEYTSIKRVHDIANNSPNLDDCILMMAGIVTSCIPNCINGFTVFLKDQTGVIRAQIDEDILTDKSFVGSIQRGAVIVVSNTTVFSTSGAPHNVIWVGKRSLNLVVTVSGQVIFGPAGSAPQSKRKRVVQKDDCFTKEPWRTILNYGYLDMEGYTTLKRVRELISVGENTTDSITIDMVVGIVQSCKSDKYGDALIEIKDETDTMGGYIHWSVFSFGKFAGKIGVGAVMVIANIVINKPSRNSEFDIRKENVNLIVTEDGEVIQK